MARICGSLARRIAFWAHLSCGVAAGALILLMSVTGVVLTYEQQIIAWAAQRNHLAAVPASPPLSAEQLAVAARVADPRAVNGALVFSADPAAPVVVSIGRRDGVLLNRYTGAVIEDASAGLRDFFRAVESYHRWLGGSTNGIGARLIDASNLLFLFILISGIYLWLPPVWRWASVRGLIYFRARYLKGKVRDFMWHHVFAFWALVPLFLVALSGVVISYQWANQLVFAVYGEQAPQRRGPPDGGPRGARTGTGATGATSGPRASLDALLLTAEREIAGWRTLAVPIAGVADTVAITAELESLTPRPQRQTVTLRAADASVVEVSERQGFGIGASPGQRARTWLRFVHTGEQYGLVGQTLAGLATLAACFLTYTGLALAYRRLIRPLIRQPPRPLKPASVPACEADTSR